MKILLVNLRGTRLYFPESKVVFGGSEVETFMLAKLFKSLSHDVTVLLRSKPTDSVDEIDGIHLHVLGSKNGRRLGLFWKAINQVNPDLCFIKLISEYSAVLGIWCRLHKRGFIYRAANKRDLLLAQGSNNYGWLQRLYFNLTTQGKSLLLMQSKEQLTAFSARFSENRCAFEPNFQYGPSIPPLPFDQRNGILWVGHLTPVKSPERLLALAQLLPNTLFTVVAISAPTKFAVDMETRLKALENIRFLGEIPYAKMPALFAKAKIFLNTSLSEGFPNTFLQALFAGTPLASLDVNPSSILDDQKAGQCIPDIGQLAIHLESLCLLKDEWEESQAAALHLSRQLSDIQQAEKRYQEYLSIAAHGV